MLCGKNRTTMNSTEENTSKSNDHSARRTWYHLSRIEYAIITVLLLLIGHMLLGSSAGYLHRHTCVICRLERVDYNWQYWANTSTYNKTKCCKWYQSHVEPTHEHVWSPNSAIVLFNFYGQAIGAGDNGGRPGRAIWRLTPDEQIKVYRHFPNPVDAKTLFVSLIDPAVMQDRQDFDIVNSVREWMDSQFSTKWNRPNNQHDPAHG